MQKEKRRVVIHLLAVAILCQFIFSPKIWSQSLLFHHLKIENGLSEYSVQAIYQDELGRLWIATRDGLNLYNGKNIEVFRPIMNDTTSIIGHDVYNVTGNRKGEIYIHCMTGVMLYDMEQKKFHTVVAQGIERISMGKEHLWASYKNKLYALNNKTKKLVTYHSFDKNINITCINEACNGNIYIGTRDNGLIILYKDKRTAHSFSNENIICIFEDNKHNQWIGTLKNGLYCIKENNEIVHYKHDPNNENSLSNDFIRCINQDNLGNIWIGTFYGLNLLHTQEEKFDHYFHSDEKQYSIGSNSIWCILKDNQGSLWIGSFYGGVDILNPEYLFNNYYTPGKDEKGLCGGVIGSVAEDESGNLWICSENTGLNFFNKKQRTFQWFLNENKNQTTSTKGALKDVCYDHQQHCLWIGYHLKGLNRMDIKSKKVERIHFTDVSAGNDYVRRIVPFENKLLLGTHNSVYLFNKDNRTAHPLFDNNKYKLTEKQIWDMFLDSKQRLWFSTSSEIYCYSMKSKKMSAYQYNPNDSTSLQNGNLYVFTEDKSHHIWVGSAGGGIALFNEEYQKFKRFNTANSLLIDNYVLNIATTPENNLLIATDKGISWFNTRNHSFVNYHNTDIYPFMALTERSLHVTKSGDLVIGSVNGMSIIKEDDLKMKDKKFSINFYSLSINNNIVKPGDNTRVLNKAIEYTDTINLYPKHTVLSINYSISNYIKAIRPIVYYRLTGFNNKWIQTSSSEIVYTNLSPGTYNLQIKAEAGGSGQFSSLKSLCIVVHPPFYKTAWAYTIYVILAILLFWWFIRYYTYLIRMKSSLQYAKREKLHIEQLNQMKIQFFTNISHELLTPITLIISQLESILQLSDIHSGISKKVLSTLHNTDKMNRLINELLDFSKEERGNLRLNISEQDIVKFTDEVSQPFKEYATNKNIRFSFSSTETSMQLWFDKIQLEKVIYNLLSNAFKYTKPGDSIAIHLSKKEESILIEISDTGYGISPEAIDKVFDRFYQEKKSYNVQGSGIGLALSKEIVKAHGGSISVESEVGKGSTFTVCLLQGDAHFDYNKVQKTGTEQQEIAKVIAYEKETEEIEQTPKTKKEYSILIVEDNEEMLNILAEIFTPYYDVHLASNGAEGLRQAESIQPHIILSDIMMPVMNGIELCKKIKSNLNTCHIPVVLLTARIAVEHIIFGLTNGADDYVIKPFNAKILLARCNNIIKNREILQSYYKSNPVSDTKAIATNRLDQELLDKATLIVEKYMQDIDFDIDLFAKEMCLGRTNLFRKIKGITGQTPNEFIITTRLKKSLSILKEHPQMPIYQVAMMVGFKEDSYFMRCFKKNFGKTPSEYRES